MSGIADLSQRIAYAVPTNKTELVCTHGNGAALEQGAGIDAWLAAADLGWSYEFLPLSYEWQGQRREYVERQVVVKGDTGAPLGAVSNRYKPVQPQESLELFREFCDAGQLTIETAGWLRSGRTVWAQARLGEEIALTRDPDDKTRNFLTFLTSCDTKIATRVFYSFKRVYCSNVIQSHYMDHASDPLGIKITHAAHYDRKRVKKDVARIRDEAPKALLQHKADCDRLAEVALGQTGLQEFLQRVYGNPDLPPDRQKLTRPMQRVAALFAEEDTPGAAGTLYGAVNAVTAYVDHHQRSANAYERLGSAMAGSGSQVKRRAMLAALAMAG